MRNPKGWKYVLDTIENEGFDYAFTGYSNFEEITDEEFHKLRKAFLAARKALADYLGVDD
jgi:hypothetical protein